MVVTPSFMHLSINFSNQPFSNCNLTVDAGFVKLTSDSFCGNRVFRMHIQFCCPVTCAAVVLWFFETILLSVPRSLSVNQDFRPLFLFADVFSCFVYADITLENVALDRTNNVAVLSQMFQLNAHQQSVPFQNRTCLPFSDSFAGTVSQHKH
jgi:hypothetical protein